MKYKILIFKMGAIGDVIMTTPFVRQLRKKFPKAQIDYLVGNIASKVLIGNKNIDNLVKFDEKIFTKKKIFSWLSLILKIRKQNYDMIFVLDKHKFFNITALFFGIKKRVGFDRLGKEGVLLTDKVYFDGSKHEIFYYLDLIKGNHKDLKTEIFPSREDEKYSEKIFKKYSLKNNKTICIAPGGANNPGQSVMLKLWPKERFLELITKLSVKFKVILVGDKNDKPTTKYITDRVKKNVVDLVGEASIPQTVAIMKKCRMVICNDTGPLHMATASNDKIIALFGPTDPKRFGPLSKKSKILYKPSKCCPCNDIFGSFDKCQDNKCMKKIDAEAVLNAARSFF